LERSDSASEAAAERLLVLPEARQAVHVMLEVGYDYGDVKQK